MYVCVWRTSYLFFSPLKLYFYPCEPFSVHLQLITAKDYSESPPGDLRFVSYFLRYQNRDTGDARLNKTDLTRLIEVICLSSIQEMHTHVLLPDGFTQG